MTAVYDLAATYPDHPLADLDPSPDELAALGEVLAEVDADPHGLAELDAIADGYAPDGEADPELAMAYGDPELGELLELASIDPADWVAAQQQAAVLDMARTSEDEQDAERAAGPRPRRYSAEERLARAIDRISRGTFTPPAPGYALAELSNATGNCGPTDPATGLCASPFHALACTSAHVSSSATGDIDDMDAWRSVVLSHDGREVDAIGLATRTGPGDWDDLLSSPEPADSATYYELRKILGISHKPGPAYLRPGPAVTRQELGI